MKLLIHHSCCDVKTTRPWEEPDDFATILSIFLPLIYNEYIAHRKLLMLNMTDLRFESGSHEKLAAAKLATHIATATEQSVCSEAVTLFSSLSLRLAASLPAGMIQ